MLLPGSTQQKFFCLRIARKTQGKVFLQNLVNSDANAIFIGSRLGFNCESDGGVGNTCGKIKNRRAFVSESLTSSGVFELGDSTDVTGVEIGYCRGSLALHHLDMLQTLRRTAVEIVECGIVFQYSGHDFEIRNAAGEWIREGLEDKDGDRFGINNLALDRVAFVIRRPVTGDFSANSRRGENLSKEIQNSVTADVMQRGTEQDGENSLGQD